MALRPGADIGHVQRLSDLHPLPGRGSDLRALGIALNNYAVMMASLGDLVAARPLFEESLLIPRRQVQPSVIALTAGNLAILALETGELGRADALISEALTRARKLDFRSVIAHSLATKSIIDVERGNLHQACAQLAEAIEVSRSIHDVECASFLSLAGTVAAIRHQPLRAASLWAAADRQRERVRLAEDPNVEGLRAKWDCRHGLKLATGRTGRPRGEPEARCHSTMPSKSQALQTKLEREVSAATTSA